MRTLGFILPFFFLKQPKLFTDFLFVAWIIQRDTGKDSSMQLGSCWFVGRTFMLQISSPTPAKGTGIRGRNCAGLSQAHRSHGHVLCVAAAFKWRLAATEGSDLCKENIPRTVTPPAAWTLPYFPHYF